MLKIFGYAESINVRKVLWICEELSLPFERQDWAGRFRSTEDPQFKTMSPFGMVPVIDDSGIIVRESNTIVRYLVSSRGRTDLLPESPSARAHVEQWMDWQASDFNNSWRVAFQALVRGNPAIQDPDSIAASIEQFSKCVGIIDSQLSHTGAYIAGKHFTVADIPIGLSLHRWRSMPMIRPYRANVERYYELLLTRQGFVQYGRDGGP